MFKTIVKGLLLRAEKNIGLQMEKHIVIIDDDDALLSVMEYLLVEAGYRVTCISRICSCIS